jgi:nitroimidazol reductase NimA-like FMN-containing flavoprotein (pyridoxamine 5'-phosphate oxidase superfamily)
MAQQTTNVTNAIPLEVSDYLKLHHIITISTSSFTGLPHADTVAYSSDAHKMYFFVGEGTQLLRNIKDSRRVAFTIDDYTVDWRKVRELQGVGRCLPATNEEEAEAWMLSISKFGEGLSPSAGIPHTIVPNELHFVDYDYSRVTGSTTQVRSRTFQIEDAPPLPSQGAVATDLDRLTFEEGQIVFRPGDASGDYYVVIEGEVEIRGEGYGADQTVIRLGPGQFFGDQGALRGQRGALTCHAVTKCSLLAVDRNALRDLLEAGPT